MRGSFVPIAFPAFLGLLGGAAISALTATFVEAQAGSAAPGSGSTVGSAAPGSGSTVGSAAPGSGPSIGLAGVAPGGPRAASPAPSSATTHVQAQAYGLTTCLALAEQNFPTIWAAKARLRYMHDQLTEARTAPFSQFAITGGLGPAPTLMGNNFYSPNTDTSFTSNMGLGWRIGVEGVVPLWTFGKITNLWDAAEAQLKVGEADINKQKNQVKMDVRRAYYGLKVARDGMALLRQVIEQVDKGLDHLKKELDDGNGDEIDAFKLNTLRYELDAKRAEARRLETIALAGLRLLTGVPSLDVADTPVHPISRALLPVAQYLVAARLHRPDINMVQAGIIARRAQVELARAKYYPDLGLGLSASWQRAPEVADQLNPFIRDDANYLRYGFALVMRWQLDALPNAARVAQAEEQLEELRQTERLALGGAGVEVESAYAQVIDAQTREKAYAAAEKTARKWLVTIQQGIDVGTREDADLVDPARQWAMQRYNHLTAIMDLNLAWSSLVLATGWDVGIDEG